MFNSTAKTIEVGDHVEGGDNAEDYDHGRVIAVDGDLITVAWEQSLVQTTQSAKGLRPYGTEIWPAVSP